MWRIGTPIEEKRNENFENGAFASPVVSFDGCVSFLLTGVFVVGCGNPCDQLDDLLIEGGLGVCPMFPDCCECICLADGKRGDLSSTPDDCICTDFRAEPCTDDEQELADFLLDQLTADEIRSSGADDVYRLCL